jgi:hypothetical protein
VTKRLERVELTDSGSLERKGTMALMAISSIFAICSSKKATLEETTRDKRYERTILMSLCGLEVEVEVEDV